MWCNVLQWKEAKPSDLMDSKLKCVFEMSADGVTVCIYFLQISAWCIHCNRCESFKHRRQ